MAVPRRGVLGLLLAGCMCLHAAPPLAFVALRGAAAPVQARLAGRPSRGRRAAPSLAARHAVPPPRPDVGWADFGFGLTTKDTMMAVARVQRDGSWDTFQLEPYGPLQLEPATTALNYGQSIFEGMKDIHTKISTKQDTFEFE